jgi:hypothetical protein
MNMFGENEDDQTLALRGGGGGGGEQAAMLSAIELSISKAIEASLTSAMAPVLSGMHKLGERLDSLESAAFSGGWAAGENDGASAPSKAIDRSPSAASMRWGKVKRIVQAGKLATERRASHLPHDADAPEHGRGGGLGGAARSSATSAYGGSGGGKGLPAAESLEPLLAGDLIYLKRRDDGALAGHLTGDFATRRCGVQARGRDDEVHARCFYWLF